MTQAEPGLRLWGGAHVLQFKPSGCVFPASSLTMAVSFSTPTDKSIFFLFFNFVQFLDCLLLFFHERELDSVSYRSVCSALLCKGLGRPGVTLSLGVEKKEIRPVTGSPWGVGPSGPPETPVTFSHCIKSFSSICFSKFKL